MHWFRGILWLGSDIASSTALHIFHYRLLFPALPRKSGQHQPSPNQLTTLRLIITTQFCWSNELISPSKFLRATSLPEYGQEAALEQ